MTIRAYFETAEGEAAPFPVASELTEMQKAFINATIAVGMPRLDESTINEFVRRIELYQTYVQGFLGDRDGQVDVTRKMLLNMLGEEYVAAGTNATRLIKRDFDAAMRTEEAAYKAEIVRRKGGGG